MGQIIQFSRFKSNNVTSTHRFIITESRPANACGCIDVDIDLDIVPTDPSIAEEAVRRKYFSELNSNDGPMEIQLSEDQFQDKTPKFYGSVKGKVTKDDYKYYKFKYNGGKYEILLKALQNHAESKSSYSSDSHIQTDADLFISSIIETPTFKDHQFCNIDVGDSRIILDIQDQAKSEIPFIYIGVKRYSGDCIFELSIESIQNVPSSSVSHEYSLDTPLTDHKQCTNCLTFIPSRTISMHEVFCFRNNILCQECKNLGLSCVFKKSEFPNHWHCTECPKVRF